MPAHDTHPSRTSPLNLRRTDPAQAGLAQHLGTGLQAELAIGSLVIRLEASGLCQATRPPGAARPLLLQTPRGALALTPARDILRALTAIDLDDDPDTPLHALGMDLATQALPAGWLPLFGASTLLALPPPDAPPAPLGVTLTLLQPQARLGLAATLRGSAAALRHALSQPGWQRLPDAPQDWPLRQPLQLGTAPLPLSAIHLLAVGDVVPITRPRFGPDGRGTLHLFHGRAQAQLHLGNEPRLELTEWHPTTRSDAMDDLPHPNFDDSIDDDGGDAALDDVPIPLSFELGTLELPLSRVKALGPGSVLPLADAPTPQVAIRIGTRRVGTGELVELDGGLAVEIRHMGAPL